MKNGCTPCCLLGTISNSYEGKLLFLGQDNGYVIAIKQKKLCHIDTAGEKSPA